MKQRNKYSFLALFSIALMLLAGLQVMTYRLQPSKVMAQTGPAITSPAAGSTVSGIVLINGTAVAGAFQRYELYAKPAEASDEGYVYISAATDEVREGELGIWDTTELEAGIYDLRMRVVRLDGNYAEYFALGVRVEEPIVAPAATLTVTLATTTPATVVITPTVVVTSTDTITATAADNITETVTVTPTPTIEPSPTSISPVTVLPVEAAQIVTEGNINVRSGPGTDYGVIGGLSADASAVVTGQNQEGDWWQIENNGLNGWVLGILVTAENVDNVPVVDVAAPTNATAAQSDASTTLEESEEATSEETTSETVVPTEVAVVSAPIAASDPVSVTLVGEKDDPEALQTFLRTMMVGMGPGNAAVTVSIGTLPETLSVALTLPQTVTVVGGIVRTGEFENSQLFLTDQREAANLLEVVRQQLLDQDFTVPPQDLVGDSGQVFLSPERFATPLLFCAPNGTEFITLSTLTVAGDSEIVSLSINPVGGFGGPCGADVQPGGPDVFAVLPRLLPLAQTEVRSSGGGSGSGSGNFYVSAEAEIEGDLRAAELAAHYATQLEDEGWIQLDESEVDALFWSAWSFTDENENEWNATFYVVAQGGEENSYLATLRAENTQ